MDRLLYAFIVLIFFLHSLLGCTCAAPVRHDPPSCWGLVKRWCLVFHEGVITSWHLGLNCYVEMVRSDRSVHPMPGRHARDQQRPHGPRKGPVEISRAVVSRDGVSGARVVKERFMRLHASQSDFGQIWQREARLFQPLR